MPALSRFWKASGFFKEERSESELTWKLERKLMPQADALVQQAQKEGQFISFADKKDWMAFYGDPEKAPTKKTVTYTRKLCTNCGCF